MATLPIDYKDPILNTEVNIRKKYNVIENADGTISLEETTVYLQAPSKIGAGAINTQNVAINGKLDVSKLLATTELVSAVTEAGNGMDALVGKEIINSLTNLMFTKIVKVTGISGASGVNTKIASFPDGATWNNTVVLSCNVKLADYNWYIHLNANCSLKTDGAYLSVTVADFVSKPVEIVLGIY